MTPDRPGLAGTAVLRTPRNGSGNFSTSAPRQPSNNVFGLRKQTEAQVINGWLILTAIVGAAIAFVDGLTRAPDAGLEFAPALPFEYVPYQAAFLLAAAALPLILAYAKKVQISIPTGLFLWFVFCTTAYMKDFSYLRLPGTPLFVTEVVLAILLAVIFRPTRPHPHRPLALNISLALFMAAGVLAATRGFGGHREPMLVLRDSALVAYALFLPVGFHLFDTWRKVRILAVWFVLGTSLGIQNGLAWFLVAHGEQRRFLVTGIYAVVSLMGVMLMTTSRLMRPRVGWTLVVVLSLGLLLTNMRSLFIVLAVVGLLAIVLPGLHRKKIRSMFLVTGAAAATILACLFLLPSPHLRTSREFATLVADNLSSGFLHSHDDPNLQFRLTAWKEAWRRFEQNPLAGEGFGIPFNFDVWDNDPRPHNTFLTVLYKMGVLGFVPFLALLVCFFWLSWQAVRRHAKNRRVCFLQTILLMQVCFCVYGEANLLLESPFLASLFWAGIGIGLRLIHKLDAERVLPPLTCLAAGEREHR